MSPSGTTVPGPPLPSGERTGESAKASSPEASSRAGLSISDFLSDGSLVRLCDELTRLAGVRVELLDSRGRAIRMSERGWFVEQGEPAAPGEGAVCVPLIVEGRAIGSFAVSPFASDKSDAESRASLGRVVTLLGATTSDLCERELDLRHRVKEASALYKLSTMLPRATSVDRVLQVALELALDVLELDAGAVVLVPEDTEEVAEIKGSTETDLVLIASKGLSDTWLDDPRPLSKDRLFDRLAIGGELDRKSVV